MTAELLALPIAGIAAGLWLLWRGLIAHRGASRLGDVATSRIGVLAAGEVRITGVVEPAEVTLVSPLQRASCVWYRARVRAEGSRTQEELFAEERAVGFRVRDASGDIRVFPRGGRFDAPTVYTGRTGMLGETPPGLDLRDGPAYAAAHPEGSEADREARIAALLTVRHPARGIGGGRVDALGIPTSRRRRYEEARIEVGDVVTVVGTARPFGDLEDPDGSDAFDARFDPAAALQDPEVAASIAEARARGELVSPEAAWGNAAIPGFGIGRPVRAPVLDPEAQALTTATREEADRAERTFDLPPERLVLAATSHSPLLIAAGTPGEAVARKEQQFLLGLLGAVLAIGSAVALGVMLATG